MGNLLASEEVIATMAGTFEAATEEPLAERLVRALKAGQEAGGDKRGRQSAVVYVMESSPTRTWTCGWTSTRIP